MAAFVVRCRAFLVAATIGLVVIGCSSSPDVVIPDVVDAEPSVAPLSADPGQVPTIQELVDSGIDPDGAACFIEEIDPDGDGRFTDPDLFMVAFTACFDTSGG